MDEEVVKKYIDLVIEKISDQTKTIAEGHMMLAEHLERHDERFDQADAASRRFETEVRVRFDKMDDRFDKMDARFDNFQSEVRTEFAETQSMIKLSYAELDRRMTTLEGTVYDLAARVERLETDPS